MRLRELQDHPALAGLAIHGCASLDKWEDSTAEIACLKEVAHAHLGGKHRSWVCIRYSKDLTATTLRHEVAHLLTGHRLHNDSWRRMVRGLGGRVERRYVRG